MNNECLVINKTQIVCSKDDVITNYSDNDFGYRAHWGKRYEDVVKDWYFKAEREK
jgi:hypothetical protein